MFTPYLFFRGQCREAMTFYAALFGGEVQFLRYSDMPPGEGAEDYAESEAIMHAKLVCPEGGEFSGSDYPDGMDLGAMNGVYLSRDIRGEAQAHRIFAALSEGGTVIWPWGAMFWAPGFGLCHDRFGVPWMIMALPEGGALG